jgi:hypothetical protein
VGFFKFLVGLGDGVEEAPDVARLDLPGCASEVSLTWPAKARLSQTKTWVPATIAAGKVLSCELRRPTTQR